MSAKIKVKELLIREFLLKEDNYRKTITFKSFLILEQTHDSAQHFLKAFDSIRKKRPGGKKGGTTDEEQDLLRAMLATIATGLDAMVKQIIRDCLLQLSKTEDLVIKALIDFAEKKLKNLNSNELSSATGNKFLARILMADSQKNEIVSECINEWVSGSLQSANQLLSAMNMLGLTQEDIKLDTQRLKLIFDIRNKIIHELDINFNAPKRKRNVRSRPRMIRECNFLLEISENVLIAIYKRVPK
jgi:hypothetical protein